jgi:PncC family amidohydrolase
VVSYSKELKTQLLGVPEQLLERHGAVSSETAVAMAEGARDRLAADIAVSVTGVAGPEPDEDKPVGLIYIAVATRTQPTQVREFRFDGDRSRNRHQAAQEALKLVIECVDRILTAA